MMNNTADYNHTHQPGSNAIIAASPEDRGLIRRLSCALMWILMLGCTYTPPPFPSAGHPDIRHGPPPPSQAYVLGEGDVLTFSFYRKPSQVQKAYRIHVGDTLRVEFTHYPLLNAELLVPPDGIITLKEVGETVVVGKTVRELREEVQQKFAITHTLPEVVIDLKDYYSPVREFFAILNTGNTTQSKQLIIRADGNVSLPLIGDVIAMGKTPTQLRAEIQNRYTDLIEELLVSIEVSQEESKRVLVIGEVNQAGVYPLRSRSTLFEAIALANGLMDTANAQGILVLRKNPAGGASVKQINLRRPPTSQALLDDYYMQPYDIVYVPQKHIVQIGTALKHVYQLVPPFVGLGFGYSLSGEDD